MSNNLTKQIFLASHRGRRASVSLLAAVMVCSLLFFAGMSVDFGLVYYEKRKLQASTDLAAMAAAQNIAKASSIASGVLSANGFSASNIVGVTSGSYTQDASVAVSQRYVAGALPNNAVQLRTSLDVPLRFMRAVVPSAHLTVPALSIGQNIGEASFTAGSGLASVNGGLLNAILGGELGSTISLSAASYSGLVNTQINALTFLNALATELNVTAGTYNQLLTSSASMGQILSAEVAALNAEGQIGSVQAAAISGLTSLAAQITGAPSVSLGSLISAGVWQNAQIGSVSPLSAVQTSLNVYQVVSFAAQIANGSNLVNAASALSIPGIATVSVQLSGVEPPQTAYFALGAAGTSVHTAQIRILLNIQLLSTLSLGLVQAPVSLQVYIEAASGVAQLTSVSCGASPGTDSTATLSATSGLLSAYVGTVSPASAMTNFANEPTVSPATLLNVLNLVTVTASGEVAAQSNTQTLVFTQAMIAAQQSQEISSTNMLSNLLSTLQSSMVLQTRPSLPAVIPLLTPLLTPVFASLDGVVDTVLATLGTKLGYLDVTVDGVRCGVPALIQ